MLIPEQRAGLFSRGVRGNVVTDAFGEAQQNASGKYFDALGAEFGTN
jgi:hypothetical protein